MVKVEYPEIPHIKAGIPEIPQKQKRKLKCPYCPRTYSESWALENHVKVCAFRFKK